jgi:four helix bundle protein
MDKIELLSRTRTFAIRVFKLVDNFPKSKAADVVAYQLLKAASSVAANYRAVNRAKSKSDFHNKIKIVLEEADESNFWLTFIKDIDLLQQSFLGELDSLIKESDEFTAMFTSSVKTLNNSKL